MFGFMQEHLACSWLCSVAPPPYQFLSHSVAVSGVILWFWRIRKPPILNQVTALSVASVLLPPLSHDYTLMHLYAPWVMLVMLASICLHQGHRPRTLLLCPSVYASKFPDPW